MTTLVTQQQHVRNVVDVDYAHTFVEFWDVETIEQLDGIQQESINEYMDALRTWWSMDNDVRFRLEDKFPELYTYDMSRWFNFMGFQLGEG